MNIFVLDLDPVMAARYHCDQHLGKMLLEGAQMMSTACQLILGRRLGELYEIAYPRHPCTQWVMESPDNRRWLMILLRELQKEREFRFDSPVHRSLKVAKSAYAQIHTHGRLGRTPFAQAMPVIYQHTDAVRAYRRYYVGEKMSIQGGAKWTRRDAPDWLTEDKYLFRPYYKYFPDKH